MGKTLTLDSLREQIETKYGPLVIELGGSAPVRLMPVLRLPRERRQMVTDALTALNAVEGTDINASVDKLTDVVRAVCESADQADRLLAEIGDDGEILRGIFDEYSETTGLGDPERSDS